MLINRLQRRRAGPAFQYLGSGFSLIELLVTISILAILITVGVPNLIAFVQNSRLTSQANDLVTVLNYARSEAIKRGVRITVCSSTNNTGCAGSTTWETGFIAFVDNDGDGVVDAGDDILMVRQPLDGGNTLRSANLSWITYRAQGHSAGFFGTLRLCDERGTANARAVVVSNQGRVRTTNLTDPMLGALTCP